jgi:glycosyltransferase involved in cell wall biosynthesis
MKILQINKFFYRRGGADHHFIDLVDLSREKGDGVFVFSMRDKRNEPSDYEKYFVSNIEFGKFNLSALLRPWRIIYSFEAARKLRRLIRDFRPDVAHLHLIYHHLSPSVLSVLKKEKIPVVMTIHDWKPLCPNYLLYTQGAVCERCRGGHYIQAAKHRCIHDSCPQSVWAAFEAYAHHAKKYYEEYVDLYIAPSEFVKTMFVKWGFSADKIQVVPHFLSPAITRERAARPAPAKSEFAFVGRLNAEKGIMTLVRKWANEKIAYPLHVFGDGPLAPQLKNFVEENNLKNIILHGAVPREDVGKRLREMTALIVPSEWYEIFGLVAIEAWAEGVPIIASNFGALPELVNNSGAGIIVDFKTGKLPDALSAITDQKYRDNAVSYMSNHHSADDYYRKLTAIYTTLVQGADARRH